MVEQNLALWAVTREFYNLPGRVTLQDICRVPDIGSAFDGIVAISTFEHIHDRDRAIANCYRLLRPGGRLVILDGNFLDVRKLFDQVVLRWIHTRGAKGGLRWLFNRDQVYEDYGMGWRGKDEAVKTVFWWRRALPRFGFRVVTVLTSAYFHPSARRLRVWPLVGPVYVVAEKPRS
jgi:SAM-dependent methyltransferase